MLHAVQCLVSYRHWYQVAFRAFFARMPLRCRSARHPAVTVPDPLLPSMLNRSRHTQLYCWHRHSSSSLSPLLHRQPCQRGALLQSWAPGSTLLSLSLPLSLVLSDGSADSLLNLSHNLSLNNVKHWSFSSSSSPPLPPPLPRCHLPCDHCLSFNQDHRVCSGLCWVWSWTVLKRCICSCHSLFFTYILIYLRRR